MLGGGTCSASSITLWAAAVEASPLPCIPFEGGGEGSERLTIQCALLGRHPVRDSRKGSGRFFRTTRSHVASGRDHDVDAKAFQLGPIDRRKDLHGGLGRARRSVERERKAG